MIGVKPNQHFKAMVQATVANITLGYTGTVSTPIFFCFSTTYPP
jgi:hypothetical protein